MYTHFKQYHGFTMSKEQGITMAYVKTCSLQKIGGHFDMYHTSGMLILEIPWNAKCHVLLNI